MSALIFVVGPAGSGKSTVSKKISQRLKAAYLDKDTLATAFTEALLRAAGTDPYARDNNVYYQEHVMDLEYETLLRAAADNLSLGNDVVLDAPFGRYLGRPEFLTRAAAEQGWPDDVRPVVVRVAVDGGVVRERIQSRGLERDAWKLNHWDEFWAAAGGVQCTWVGVEQVQIDNSGAAPLLAPLLVLLGRS